MERQSDKHSARLDDEMAHEVESMLRSTPVESRTREGRVKEDLDPGDAHANPAARPDLPDDMGMGPSPDAVDARSNLARHLAGAHWPASSEELVMAARNEHAPDGILASLRRLPHEARFGNVQEVWSALGGETEDAHTHG